jgi:hypothetical protein
MKNIKQVVVFLTKMTTIALALFLTASPIMAKEVEMTIYDYKITRVIDGDTVAIEARTKYSGVWCRHSRKELESGMS